jgi:hypothetical protein
VNAKAFLDVLFGGQDENHFIEFRLIGKGRADQMFIPFKELFSDTDKILAKLQSYNKNGANVYFGVLPRLREAGDASAVGEGSVLWVDIDSKEAKVNEDCRRLTAAGLNPSILLDSGHGWHLYFLLREPIPHERAAAIMNELARVVGGDKVSDAPRIMRLPDFLNVKREPVPCRIVKWEPSRVFNPSDFDVLGDMPASTVPSAPAAPAKPIPHVIRTMARDSFLKPIADLLVPFWGNGHRHKLALALGGLLKKNDIDAATAQKVVRAVAETAGDEECEDRLRACTDSYSAADPAGAATVEEIFGDKSKDFFSAFNVAVSKVPPPPTLRLAWPEFEIDTCVPPDSPILKYVTWAYDKTDAPILFHVASYMALCASAIGNKVSLNYFGNQQLHPNLYFLLCAPSTRYRKSTAINMVRKISTATKAPVYPNNCTQEQLYACMATKEVEFKEPDRKGGKPVCIAWSGEPFGMIYYPEFATFLDLTAKNYMNDIRSLYMDMYDGSIDKSTGSRQTKTQGKHYISNPAISLLCGSTPQSLRQFVGQSGFQNGFLARFLLLAAHPAHECRFEWNSKSPEEELASTDEFNKICNGITSVMEQAGLMTASTEAKDVLTKFEKEINTRIREIEWTDRAGIDSMLARLPTMAAKIGMIHCLLRGTPYLEMSAADAQYAVNFCTFSANTLPLIYEHIEPEDVQNREVNYKKKVLKTLRGMMKKSPDGLVPHRNLLQNSNLTSGQLSEALKTLQAEGRLLEQKRGRGMAYRLNEVDEFSGDKA